MFWSSNAVLNIIFNQKYIPKVEPIRRDPGKHYGDRLSGQLLKMHHLFN